VADVVIRLLLLLAGLLWTQAPAPVRKSKASGHAKRQHQAALAAQVRVMSPAQRRHFARQLRDLKRRRARRWACDLDHCNGDPHKGWLHRHARASQRMPRWRWTTWLMLTGRGWGKTRTGAEAVREWAQKPNQHIAVVAKKATLCREICFESPKSGLLAVIPPEEIASYHSDVGNLRLILKNGTVIRGFGAEVPDNLRGWAFDKGWADEYAAWNRHTAQGVMDMLWFCLREAEEPQVVISTTPKPLPHIIKLVERHEKQQKRLERMELAGQPGVGPRVALTVGHMRENAENLSRVALEELTSSYAGTRLGDQELAGLVLTDVEGALWQRWMFEVEDFRLDRNQIVGTERLVVAVDPAVTSTETADEVGFAVAGRGYWRDVTYADQRPRGYVFHSEAKRMTPMQTMAHAAKLYHQWKADAVILEANNGGEYLSTVLTMVDPTVNFRIVHAQRDKRARATPVAGLYEQSRIHHVGPPKLFDQLEQVMTTYVGAHEREEKSPDILDALVWAMTDLFLDPTTTRSRAPQTQDRRLDGRR
jgi:phage terminase large subunit-like protein